MRRSRTRVVSMGALLAGAAAALAGCGRTRCPCTAPVRAHVANPPPAAAKQAAKPIAVVVQPAPRDAVKGPTDLAAIGRVAALLFTPPAAPGEIAKDATLFWEFAADKKKLAFVPGDYVVPNKEATKRFRLVDVVRDDPDVSRWRILYDVYEVPGDDTKTRRAELVYDNEAKRKRPPNDPFGLGPGSCVLPLPPGR